MKMGPASLAVVASLYTAGIDVVSVLSLEILGSSKLTGMEFLADYLACSPGGCDA